jgi:hypothetical protein
METSEFLQIILAGLLTRSPLMLIAVVGIVLSWVKIRPVSKSSHRVCVTGLLFLATHAVADVYTRAYSMKLAFSGATREELFRFNGGSMLALYALLLLGVSCLVVAAVTGRTRSKALVRGGEMPD